MNILYLHLSVFLYNRASGPVLGLSIDEQPSEEAREIAHNLASPAASTQEQHTVTIASHATRLLGFKARADDGSVEIVVLTFQRTYPCLAPIFVCSLDITLTPNSEFTIRTLAGPPQTFPTRSPTGNVSLVLMTPVLAQVVSADNRWRCDADVADGEQCRLKRIHERLDSRWCPFHLDQKVFLHDEELEKRKKWFREVNNKKEYCRRNKWQNLQSYSEIQESLALRTIITEVLYRGNENAGHAIFVDVTKRNRRQLLEYLRDDQGYTGPGRLPIMAGINRFLTQARIRETRPTSEEVRRRELTVKLADVRKIRDFHGHDVTPSIFHLLTGSGGPSTFTSTFASTMYGRLRTRARSIGNLPPWYDTVEKLLLKPREEVTIQERIYLMWRSGMGVPPNAEQALAEDDEFYELIEIPENQRTDQQKARLEELGKVIDARCEGWGVYDPSADQQGDQLAGGDDKEVDVDEPMEDAGAVDDGDAETTDPSGNRKVHNSAYYDLVESKEELYEKD